MSKAFSIDYNVDLTNNRFIEDNKIDVIEEIILSNENTTVTVKAFIKVNNVWRSSNLNNANFLGDTWDSFWTSKILAACWITAQCLHNGSCDWDLTDTPITVDKLFKALYEYTDWVVELDRDRQAGEWEIVT